MGSLPHDGTNLPMSKLMCLPCQQNQDAKRGRKRKRMSWRSFKPKIQSDDQLFFSQCRELLPAKLQTWWYSVRAIVISREEGGFGIETSWERGHSLDQPSLFAAHVYRITMLLCHVWKRWHIAQENQIKKFLKEKKNLLPEAWILKYCV